MVKVASFVSLHLSPSLHYHSATHLVFSSTTRLISYNPNGGTVVYGHMNNVALSSHPRLLSLIDFLFYLRSPVSISECTLYVVTGFVACWKVRVMIGCLHGVAVAECSVR